MNKLEDTVRSCFDSVNIASIYLTGWQLPPHYPMPAIRFTAELVHHGGRVNFLLMHNDYQRGMGYMRCVGDFPNYPLKI